MFVSRGISPRQTEIKAMITNKFIVKTDKGIKELSLEVTKHYDGYGFSETGKENEDYSLLQQMKEKLNVSEVYSFCQAHRIPASQLL